MRAFLRCAFVKNSDGIPRCECGGIVKPDVVLYEEGLDSNTIQGAVDAIAEADTLIIGGTSLVVYPAAGFIDYFRGRHLVVINKSETAKAVRAELNISAPIGQILEDSRIITVHRNHFTYECICREDITKNSSPPEHPVPAG